MPLSQVLQHVEHSKGVAGSWRIGKPRRYNQQLHGAGTLTEAQPTTTLIVHLGSSLGCSRVVRGIDEPLRASHNGASVRTVDDGRAQRQSVGGLTTIIGGAGFIGRRLAAQLLLRGDAVRVVDIAAPTDSDVEYRTADVRDRDALAAAVEGADVIYNLAAVHRDDVTPTSLYHDVNVTGAANLTRACRDLGINRLIFSSSVAVYGPSTTDISEDQAPNPTNDYGRSKLRAEQEYRRWQYEAPQQRNLVIVRPSVVFGEGNRGNVYRLLQQIIGGRFVMVGSGQNRKSMAYVENLCAFLVHVADLGAGTHLYNYADKPDLSMNELVSIILHELGRPTVIRPRVPYPLGYLGGLACDVVAYATKRKLPISRIRVRKFCTTTTFAANRLRNTQFAPPVALRETIHMTIKHEVSAP